MALGGKTSLSSSRITLLSSPIGRASIASSLRRGTPGGRKSATARSRPCSAATCIACSTRSLVSSSWSISCGVAGRSPTKNGASSTVLTRRKPIPSTIGVSGFVSTACSQAPPSSTGMAKAVEFVRARPPMRAVASSTSTLRPAAASCFAAASPERPAPTTTTSYLSPSGVGPGGRTVGAPPVAHPTRCRHATAAAKSRRDELHAPSWSVIGTSPNCRSRGTGRPRTRTGSGLEWRRRDFRATDGRARPGGSSPGPPRPRSTPPARVARRRSP